MLLSSAFICFPPEVIFRSRVVVNARTTATTPAPHKIRFVIRSDELLNSKYKIGRSAIKADGPIEISRCRIPNAYTTVCMLARNTFRIDATAVTNTGAAAAAAASLSHALCFGNHVKSRRCSFHIPTKTGN